MIGVAPRRPTQATTPWWRSGTRNALSDTSVASGRATTTRTSRDRQGRPRDVGEIRREHQQPQEQEHPDLAQPRHGFVEAPDRGAVDDVVVPDPQAGQVHGQEAAPAQHGSAGVGSDGDREGDDGVEAVGAGSQPVEELVGGPACRQAEACSESQLSHQRERQVHRAGTVADHDRHQRHREQDRHRVVGPGLQLQGRLDGPGQRRPLGAQDGEDRGGIRRRHDRAEQQPGLQREVEDHRRGQTRDDGTDHHADRRQRHGRADDRAYPRPPCRQAAVEQDEGQRRDTDSLGQLGVVEVDAAGTVRARQHPQREEQQQRRKADACRELRPEGRRQHQRRADDQCGLDRAHQMGRFPRPPAHARRRAS